MHTYMDGRIGSRHRSTPEDQTPGFWLQLSRPSATLYNPIWSEPYGGHQSVNGIIPAYIADIITVYWSFTGWLPDAANIELRISHLYWRLFSSFFRGFCLFILFSPGNILTTIINPSWTMSLTDNIIISLQVREWSCNEAMPIYVFYHEIKAGQNNLEELCLERAFDSLVDFGAGARALKPIV